MVNFRKLSVSNVNVKRLQFWSFNVYLVCFNIAAKVSMLPASLGSKLLCWRRKHKHSSGALNPQSVLLAARANWANWANHDLWADIITMATRGSRLTINLNMCGNKLLANVTHMVVQAGQEWAFNAPRFSLLFTTCDPVAPLRENHWAVVILKSCRWGG